MTELARALGELLARERQAALLADVDALEALQADKRALLDEAERAGALDTPSFERLAAVARSNLGLIRQLVGLHRALAGMPPPAYGADGQRRTTAEPVLVRRAL